MSRYNAYSESVRVGRELAEALDEVERLRGVVERLELEKFDLTERLMRAQEQGMGLAAAADNAPTAASRTRGQGIPS